MIHKEFTHENYFYKMFTNLLEKASTTGNKFRLIVQVNDEYGIVYIRFIGTPAEYTKIDAEII